MNEVIYLYDNSFEGFLCCIFDSYLYRERPAAIQCDEAFFLSLFPTRQIHTDPEHAKRVLRKIVKVSPYTVDLLKKGFLTCMPDKEMALYHLAVKVIDQGPVFLRNLSDDTLLPVLRAVRHLYHEAEQLRGFVRFSEMRGVLGSEIEPKNRILPLLRGHFCSRYRNECFFIYDRTHKEVLLYSGGTAAIYPLEAFEMAPPDEAEAKYRLLWKRFYDTIAIESRYNPTCRRTHMPKRYWNTMTEFQDESHFTPRSSGEAGPTLAAPDGTPAPGKPPKSWPSAPGSAP